MAAPVDLTSEQIRQALLANFLTPISTLAIPAWDPSDFASLATTVAAGADFDVAAVGAAVAARGADVAAANAFIDAQIAAGAAAGAAPDAAELVVVLRELAARTAEGVAGTPAQKLASVQAVYAAMQAALPAPGGPVAAEVAAARAAGEAEFVVQRAIIRGGAIQRGGSRATVKAAVSASLGLPARSVIEAVIHQIIDGPTILSKKGFLIYNVPKSDELLARFCTIFYARSKGWNVNMGNFVNFITSDAYKSMPKSDLDTCDALLNIPAAVRATFDAWDRRVEQIRDAMSVNPVGRGANVLPALNRIQAPVYQSVSSFTRYPGAVQQGLIRIRTPTNTSVAQTMGQLQALRVIASQTGGKGQRGGNPHAPLYPRMVMNGGAHPFATLSGGAIQPAQVLIDKVNSLKTQFQQITGSALPNALPNDIGLQIDNYANQVNQQLKDVQDKLKVIAGANASLAQYPLGMGVTLQMDEASLKEYAKHAQDLNNLAQKAMRKLDKLAEIKDLLQDLVDKQSPAKLNP